MKRFLWILFSLIILVAVMFGVYTYHLLFSSATSFSNDSAELLIYPKTSLDDLKEQLVREQLISNEAKFAFSAKLLKFKTPKPGRYIIPKNRSNIELVRQFRSGNQTPVRMTFNNIRTKKEFAEKVGHHFLFGTDSLLNALNDSLFLKKYGVTPENVLVLLIPNTYEFFWNIPVSDFFDRMFRYYQKFWNEKRLRQAQELNLSPVEVSILASIVEEENHRIDEQAKIAGLYLNRLKKDMLLQADPTVKFAVGDFTLTQILYQHLDCDSPYNTYKYKGLPPGPLRIPEATAVDAVLNAENHNYIFMCAKEDLSGYHNFATTMSGHASNVAKYHAAYKIWKNR